MRIKLYSLLLLTVVLFFSCSKNLEESLTGNWQLTRAWKQQLFGRDYFQTGYENGTFTFMDNGNASYVNGADTLTGFWRAYRYNDNFYNSGSGEWENRSNKYLRISLANYPRNLRLEWEFDDFNFRDHRNEIRAEQFTLGNSRIYQFEKR